MKERKLLQESLREKFDSKWFTEPRIFNDLVNSLNKIWNFDRDWVNELISDYEIEYTTWIRI